MAKARQDKHVFRDGRHRHTPHRKAGFRRASRSHPKSSDRTYTCPCACWFKDKAAETKVHIVRLGCEQTQTKFLHHLAIRPFAKSRSTPHFRKSSIMPTSSSRRNANRARCRMTECGKFAQTRGLCKAHGGGSRCRDPNCQKLAQSRGLCIAHGGGRRCAFDGCSKLAQSKGFCISHGGGRRCHVADCDKFAQVRGHCKSHSKLISSESWSPVSVSRSTTSDSNIFSPKTMSPNKSKLSIDFLVNPCGMASDHKDEVLSGFHTTLPHQRSLLSYLDPMTTLASTAAAMQTHSSMSMPAHYPPLVLYR